jgi:hypothetical protein
MKLVIKDPRIAALRDQIALGNVQKFEDIIHHIPKSNLTAILGTNNKRMSRILEKPEDIVIRDLIRISNSFNISLPLLGKIAINGVLFNRGDSLIPVNGIYKIKNQVEGEMTFLISNRELE